MELLYEGKAKKIFVSKELPEGSCIMHFKDDATAFNNEKHETFKGKGELNCWITEYMLQMLEEMYIPTHYIGNNSKNVTGFLDSLNFNWPDETTWEIEKGKRIYE